MLHFHAPIQALLVFLVVRINILVCCNLHACLQLQASCFHIYDDPFNFTAPVDRFQRRDDIDVDRFSLHNRDLVVDDDDDALCLDVDSFNNEVVEDEEEDGLGSKLDGCWLEKPSSSDSDYFSYSTQEPISKSKGKLELRLERFANGWTDGRIKSKEVSNILQIKGLFKTWIVSKILFI